jgi:hypothetical protein
LDNLERLDRFLVTRLDCEDGFYGLGFETGALIDVREDTYRVLLCVRTPAARSMRLYAVRQVPT